MTQRLFIPRDATALSLGAHEVALAFRRELDNRKLDTRIVRTGTRGAFWLEPMVEVETPAGRIAYGPVTAEAVPGLLEAGILTGAAHPLRLGKPEDLPWFARQQRLTYGRCGITDPLSLADYEAAGGLKGLRRALEIGPAAIVAEVTASGLR